MADGLEERIQACEQENAQLRKRITRQNTVWVAALLLFAGGGAIAGASLKNAVFDSVRAKEVVVVDANGVVRARLGGDLPDAVAAHGRQVKRGSKAGGLIIYDEEGIERGGYVTQDTGSNAMLTLDSKYHQATWFIAGPSEDQTSSLKLWGNASAIELRSDENGSRLNVSDKSGVIFQQPMTASLPPAACSEFKELHRQYPRERICRARYTEAACKACLGDG